MAPTQRELEALRGTRAQTIDRLTEHFVRDDLDVAEYEHRLALAHRAEAAADLERVTADLPPLQAEPHTTAAPPVEDKPAPRSTATPAPLQRPVGLAVALMGGAQRRGAWTPPRSLTAIALMGGVELDFREARLGPGVTEVTAFALMGDVEIIVPPTLHVETHGIGIMGGFDALDRSPTSPDPTEPVLRIRGLALMGGVEVKTRLPGESAREARRRQRLERRQERRRLR